MPVEKKVVLKKNTGFDKKKKLFSSSNAVMI